MSIFKKKFDTLNLLEHFDYLKILENKVKNKMDNAKGYVIIISALMVFIIALVLPPQYFSIGFILPLSPLFTLMLFNQKIIHYYKKKLGYHYHNEDIKNILDDVDNQKKIIEYFNDVVKNDSSLSLANQQLKKHFQNKEYNEIIRMIRHILSVTENQHINDENLKKLQIESQDYEKMIGVENTSVLEKEVEHNGNLKKYL